MTSTTNPANDNTASIPVPLSLVLPASRRTDLPDVYTVEVEVGGKVITRRHFRIGDDGQPFDDTELVVQHLLERAQNLKAAERKRQAEQVERVGAVTPERQRKTKGRVVIEGTMKAGVNRARALSSLGVLNQRKLLTTRQFEAGDRLAQDVRTMAGARDARDDGAPAGPSTGSRDWEDFAVAAGRHYQLAREVCQSLPPYDGIPLWSVVEAVVINDLGLVETAGGATHREARERHKIALRVALDAIGDIYRLPSKVIRTTIHLAGTIATLTYTEDFDGPSGETHTGRPLLRSISLDGHRWIATAPTAGDLFDRARAQLANDQGGTVAAET